VRIFLASTLDMLGSCIGRLQKVVDFSPAEKWVAAVQRVGRAQSSRPVKQRKQKCQ